MRHHFDRPEQLAHFLGISVSTLQSWLSGRRRPTRAAQRLLSVLEAIEGTPLFDALVEQSKRATAPVVPERKPITGPYWSPGTVPVVTDEIRAMLRESEREWMQREAASVEALRPAPRRIGPSSKREDSYFFDRTVTQDEADEDVTPAVVVTNAYMNKMTPEQEDKWLDEMREYEQRTGRVFRGFEGQY